MARFDLSDFEWAVIEPQLPKKDGITELPNPSGERSEMRRVLQDLNSNSSGLNTAVLGGLA